ncbi:MAG TPA: ATP-dependent Clp protease adapter ClpS [Blastocatellia bacterium]|nr:ATP-dependent Clp protease adapter ClpS [Blastocatellia bacterium]
MGNLDHDEGVVTESKQKVKKPSLYKVLLHNDDYTTMDFVVFILQTVFQRSEADATRIMLEVHNGSVGVAGVYTYEIAETKAARVEDLARQNDFPLLATLEED